MQTINIEKDFTLPQLDVKEKYQFIFSNTLTEEELIHIIEQIYTKEVELLDQKTPVDIELHVKNLDFKKRVAIFKYALTHEDIVDSYTILNLFNLLKGYNTFEDSFFQSPAVFLNSLVEFVDLRADLKAEIEAFTKKLILYYLAIFKSVGITEFTEDNKPIIIPYVYQRFILISNFVSMSNILLKETTFPTEIPTVANAGVFITQLAGRFSIANLFMHLGEK